MAQGKPLTEWQKRVIAKGKIMGKTQKQIAAEANCSPDIVGHMGRYPAIKTMMQALLNQHSQLLTVAMGRFIQGIIDDHDSEPTNFAKRQSCRAEMARMLMIGEGNSEVAQLGGEGAEAEVSMRELLIHMREVVVTKKEGGTE